MSFASRDGRLLLSARIARMFAFGSISIVLVLYLAELGWSGAAIGALLTLTLIGDTVISLFIATRADRWGRKNTLVVGALLVLAAGLTLGASGHFLVLVVAATLGVLSPSGNEVGPFLSVEQAALSQILDAGDRTRAFAWYALAGALATATGALAAGVVSQGLQSHGMTPAGSYRAILFGYAAIGLLMVLVFAQLSDAVEIPRSRTALLGWLGLGASRPLVLRLAALFALDAFGGGFIVQSVIAYWFHDRFAVEPAAVGAIFFGTHLLGGVSALLAARLASRIGLVRTMVFTHLPSNVVLLLVPLMPSLELAVLLLLARSCVSQMDVPTRQALTMTLATPEERSAAAGVTAVARTTGAALSPFLAAILVATVGFTSWPFFLAGGCKLAYDLLLYFRFRGLEPRRS